MRFRRHLIAGVLFLSCGIWSHAADRSAAPTLRLLSYNIRHGQGMDGKIDLERIAKVIARRQPDLVALQEVDKVCRRSGRRDLAAELGAALNMQHRFGTFMDFQGGQYGLAVLSRLPILASARHPLPEGAEPRCALEVQVRPNRHAPTISFVCIHNDWTNEAIRLTQVRALLAALSGRAHPVILAGDFNGERRDASLELLVDEGWALPEKRAPRTWPAVQPRVEIDFFALRGFPGALLQHEVIPEVQASDHRPIFAVIPLPDP
jgi:endonuclease/exonuclease/phosphatase family metal-dependent hydrolase